MRPLSDPECIRVTTEAARRIEALMDEYVNRPVRINPDGSIDEREQHHLDAVFAPFGMRVVADPDLRLPGAGLRLVPREDYDGRIIE